MTSTKRRLNLKEAVVLAEQTGTPMHNTKDGHVVFHIDPRGVRNVSIRLIHRGPVPQRLSSALLQIIAPPRPQELTVQKESPCKA